MVDFVAVSGEMALPAAFVARFGNRVYGTVYGPVAELSTREALAHDALEIGALFGALHAFVAGFAT